MSQADLQLRRAFRLHQAGDLTQAAEIYASILGSNPSEANALHLLGMIRHEQGNSQEALALVQRAIAVKPDERVLYNSLGVVQLALGRYDDARAALERAIAIDPSAGESHSNLGLALMHLGMPEAAEVCFEEALRRDPQNAKPHLHLGEMAEEAGNHFKAEGCFRQAVAADVQCKEAYLALTRLLAKQNRHGEARELLQRAADRRPLDPEVHFELGAACAREGSHEQAIDALERSLAIRPNSAVAHDQIGMSFLALGKSDKATTHFQKAIDLAGANRQYRVHLAAALRQGGRLEEAREHLQRVVDEDPQSIEALCQLGALQRQRGCLEEAEQLLDRALQARPAKPEALFEIAQLHEHRGGIDKTVACCVRALKEDRDCVPAHLFLGLALSSRLGPEHRAELSLSERRELTERALGHLQRAAALSPSAETFAALGSGLIRAEKHVEAIESLKRSIGLCPAFTQAHLDLGKAYLEVGEMDRAERSFRESLEIDPFRAEAHYELSRFGRAEDSEQAIPQLEEFLARDSTASREQMFARFALARYLDSQRDHHRAFAEYLRANALKTELPGGHLARRKTQDEGPGSDERRDWYIRVFDEAFWRERRGWGNQSDLAVFIVGMPRSGTTLVEQILSSHPQIHGAGELIDVSDLATSLPRRLAMEGRYPEIVPAVTEKMASELAGEYLNELRNHNHSSLRITDKMPTNFWHLGLIGLLLPRSRVIHVIRDPRDVCVSCLKQNLEWPFCDLTAVGRYYRNYERLMEHWKSVLSLAILDVHYEQLVADHSAESRRMIDFCGLPWDDQCLDFASTGRAVQTPSKWQVRQPIYRSSVGAWKKYASHLQPLEDVLAGG